MKFRNKVRTGFTISGPFEQTKITSQAQTHFTIPKCGKCNVLILAVHRDTKITQ